jgi:iron-sulfur cluster assembly accessory protein
MITITPAAIEKLKELFDAAEEIVHFLRIGVRGGGCSGYQYAMEFVSEQGPMDTLILDHELPILIDGISAMYLKGTTLDYVETLEVSGFKFNNPNAKTTCGCGSSFS